MFVSLITAYTRKKRWNGKVIYLPHLVLFPLDLSWGLLEGLCEVEVDLAYLVAHHTSLVVVALQRQNNHIN